MFASKSFTLLSGLSATLLAMGCGDSLSPDRHAPEAPDFSHGGAHPRILGEGTIGTGEPTPGDDRQEFSFDAAVDLTGRLFYRDWSVVRADGVTVGTVTVDPADPETGITVFRPESAACADPTKGAEFDGTGRLDTGDLVGFTVAACDNGPAESGADFFRMSAPALDNYTRSGFLTNGDIVKEPEEASPPGPATRISGLGTIGPGTPTPNSDLQEFDFDVGADLTGDLFFRDWSVVRADGITVGTVTVDPADPGTGITAFRDGSAACADPTKGAEFDGTGRLDTGDLVGFTVAACDNGPAESGADFFRLDVPSREYTRSGFLSSGDIVKGTEAPPPEPPAAPTSLMTTPVSSSQIDLSWVDNATDEDGFKIERRLGTEADAAFAQIAQVGANVTTHSDAGLAASTEYCYRVRAFNAGGNSTYSNTSCATTQAPPPPPAATQLAFVVQPSTTTAGSPISPAVQVAAQDDAGNTVTSFTGDVTVAIGTNPGGGTLSGTKTVAAVNGVATFSDLSIDKVGDGYTLVATASGLPDETSAPFNITPGAATKLVFTVQPSNTLAGAVITPPVKVTAQDANGNTATGFTGTVTVAIGNNPTGDGVLDGTKSVAAVSGVATFSDLSIKKAGNGYTLAASAQGLTGAESARFDITPRPATQLAFTVQPSNTVAGAFISPPVQVTARDEFGNKATGFTGTVTVAIGTNPTGEGVLEGTKSVAAVSGVATFSDLSIKKAGNGYTLTASADGLTGAESDRFDITPRPATHLAFTVQPSNTVAGAFISPPVQVTARDEFGNKATGFTGTVTVAIGVNPGGGTLDGTKSVAAVSGVATFSDLSIKKAAKDYTLTARADGLTGDESAPFDITPGAATQLAFTKQPTNTLPLVTMAPVEVEAEDAFGNKVKSFEGFVTIAIGKNGGLLLPGTLSGTKTVKAVSGYATFKDLSIDQPGPGYTLVANSYGLQGAESNPFDVLTPLDPPLPPLP